MQTPKTRRPTLAEYVDLETLIPHVRETFPTTDSVRWFVRCHRAYLVAAEALIFVSGRLRFHPARFQHSVLEIGSAQAARIKGAPGESIARRDGTGINMNSGGQRGLGRRIPADASSSKKPDEDGGSAA